SRDVRHRHPFPTRRSSDLTRQPESASPPMLLKMTSHRSIRSATVSMSAPTDTTGEWRFGTRILVSQSPPSITKVQRFDLVPSARDRKSTRLNSSHVSISYA